MAHPFFETVAYKADLPEAKELERVLNDAYRTSQPIDAIYRKCSSQLPALNLNQPPGFIWKEALDNLIRNGLMRKLCEMVRDASPGNPDILKTIQAVIDAVGPEKLVRLRSGMLILNRKTFREQLEKLESPQSTVSVQLVRGVAKSGKSHGRHLFFEMAKNNGAKGIYIRRSLVSTVEQAANMIFSTLGVSNAVPPLGDTTKVAWYQNICLAILARAEEARITAWIAVDDLGPDPQGEPLLDPEIRMFFEQFAAYMSTPQFQERFRLLLIHYPEGDVPTHWLDEFWQEDRTSATDLTREDVIAALREEVKRQGRSMLEDDYKTEADRVITIADELSPVERLKSIFSSVTSKLQNLTSSNP